MIEVLVFVAVVVIVILVLFEFGLLQKKRELEELEKYFRRP
jgi:hypothetical protein